MIEQINMTNRDLSNVYNGDSSRLKLSPTSKGNIESNILKNSNLVEKKVEVRNERVAIVNGGGSMDYVIHDASYVPVSAIEMGRRAVKTKKINDIRRNGGMTVSYKDESVSNVTNSSYIDAMNQSLNSTPSVEVVPNNVVDTAFEREDNTDVEEKVKVGGNHSILSKINHFSEKGKIKENIDINKINLEANNNIANDALDSKAIDTQEIENKANDSLAKEVRKVPMFGGSDSDIFGETSLNDKPIVSAIKEEPKVTTTNDLISSIPNNTVKPEKDELSVVHDKLFDIKHDETKDEALERFANADIDNMSIEDLKQLMNGVKRISEDTVHAEEENNRLERENGAYLEETKNLTSEVSEAKRRFIEEVNRQKESSLKAQREANERHGKLVSEREALESKKTNAKAQLDEINKIRDEFIGGYSNSSSVRSR